MQELFSKHTENVHLTLLILNYPMHAENKWQLGRENIFNHVNDTSKGDE